MKKIAFLAAVTLLLAACSGSKENKEEASQIDSTLVQELDETSEQVITKSEELNQKADSLLNSL